MTANLTTLCAELRRLKQKATSDGARLADSDALIAAMRNALPALLDAAERMVRVEALVRDYRDGVAAVIIMQHIETALLSAPDGKETQQ